MSARLAARLRADGHDVDWVGTWPADPGDPEILRRAHVAGRVVVTLDKGFGRLAFEARMPHSGIIWLRNVSPLTYHARIAEAIELHGVELGARAVLVIGIGRTRVARSAFDEEA